MTGDGGYRVAVSGWETRLPEPAPALGYLNLIPDGRDPGPEKCMNIRNVPPGFRSPLAFVP